jgi:H+/gluconate symporter-like permease
VGAPIVVSDAVASAVGTAAVVVGTPEVAGAATTAVVDSPNPAGTTIRTAWSAESTTTVLMPLEVASVEEQAVRAATRQRAIGNRRFIVLKANGGHNCGPCRNG